MVEELSEYRAGKDDVGGKDRVGIGGKPIRSERQRKKGQTGGLVSWTRFKPESTHMQEKRHRLSQTAD